MKIRNRKKTNILQAIAEKHHIPESEVRKEIELAIQEGMKSTSPDAREFWSQFNGTPTPEEVIAAASRKVSDKM